MPARSVLAAVVLLGSCAAGGALRRSLGVRRGLPGRAWRLAMGRDAGEVSRSEALAQSLLSAAVVAGVAAGPRAARAEGAAPKVTQRIQLDLSVVKDFQANEKEPLQLTLGLFGRDAPDAVKKTLLLATEAGYNAMMEDDMKPNYKGAFFLREMDGVLELGPVRGVREVLDNDGAARLEYNKQTIYKVPSKPERNGLVHDGPGLLTRSRYQSEPSFGVTLRASPSRDRDGIVFGQVLDAQSSPGWLEKLQAIPLYSDNSMEKQGSLADEVFRAQRKFFRSVAQAAKDTRAEDRKGLLLKRVQIVGCRVLSG